MIIQLMSIDGLLKNIIGMSMVKNMIEIEIKETSFEKFLLCLKSIKIYNL